MSEGSYEGRPGDEYNHFDTIETLSYVVICPDGAVGHYATLEEAVRHWGQADSLRAVVQLTEAEYEQANGLARVARA